MTDLSRWLHFLGLRQGEPIEIQALGVVTGRGFEVSKFAHVDNSADALRLISELDGPGCMGLFVLGNKIHPAVASRAERGKWHTIGKGGGTTDRDITHRRVVFVDVDAVRPKGTSSTAEEVARTEEVAQAVCARLATILGDDAPLGIGDSGNGRGVFIALDNLPECEEVARPVRGVVAALGAVYSTPEVHIDPAVTDAKRLMPAFGSTKRKGAAGIPERPHRRTSFRCADKARRLSLEELTRLHDTLVAELTAEQCAAYDKAMGVRPQAPSSTRQTSTTGDPFRRANQCDPSEVASRLGLYDGDDLKCPGCGTGGDSSVAIVDGGMKCQHARCADKGPPGRPGFRTCVDMVAEVQGCKPIEAVRQLGEWFGFEVPKRERKATGKKQRVQGPIDLILGERGNPRAVLANVLTVLTKAEQWRGVVAYDAFADKVVSLRPPPARLGDAPQERAPGAWIEADDARTSAWLSSEHNLHVTTGLVQTAVCTLARGNVVHPVRKAIESVTWDGTARIDNAFVTYWGAASGPYTTAVARMFFIGAIARVFEPGCKLDTMPVLEGPQGGLKSTSLRVMFDPWFQDSGINLGDKDSYQALRGVWCYEFAEFQSVKAARDLDRVKNFISSATDHYRASYGHYFQDVPRQCVFAATTNDEVYLADRTGNRRFLPVRCGTIDLEALRRDRPQLWAEALVLYRAKKPWYVTDQEVAKLCAEEQQAREVPDDWIPIVAKWLEKPTMPTFSGTAGKLIQVPFSLADGLTTADCLIGAIDMKPAQINQAATTRMGHVLRKCLWEPDPNPKTRGDRRVRIYQRAQPAQPRQASCAEPGVHHDTAQKGSGDVSAQPAHPDPTHTQREEQADDDLLTRARKGPADGVRLSEKLRKPAVQGVGCAPPDRQSGTAGQLTDDDEDLDDPHGLCAPPDFVGGGLC
jgi:predicted P-loop ATPase